jgi:hypothetical protein
MTTDFAVLERALIVMAVCLVIQTLLFVGAAIGAYIAWRRASVSLAEAQVSLNAQIAHLRGHVDRISQTVDEVGHSILKSSTAVGDAVSDVRGTMGSVRNSVGSVASVVTAPRTALALGVLRGIQAWRKRREPDGVARQV